MRSISRTAPRRRCPTGPSSWLRRSRPQARNFVHDVALNFLESDQFKQLWEQVNRIAHAQIKNIITGKKTAGVQTENGKVVISLRPIAEQVLTKLDQVVPVDLSNVDTSRLNTEFVLVDSKDLGSVQTGVKWFNRATYILLLLAIASLVASALLPRDKRRAVQRVGLAITISMAVTLVAYRAGRSFYISSLPAEVTHPDAATAAFDIITRYVERGIETLLILGVVLFVVAWVLGPSALPPVSAAGGYDCATEVRPSCRGRTRSGGVVGREASQRVAVRCGRTGRDRAAAVGSAHRTGRAPAHAADGSGSWRDLGDRRSRSPLPDTAAKDTDDGRHRRHRKPPSQSDRASSGDCHLRMEAARAQARRRAPNALMSVTRSTTKPIRTASTPNGPTAPPPPCTRP